MPVSPSRRRWGWPVVVLLGGSVLLVLLGVGVALHAGVGSSGAAAPAATPTIDPRLIIHPRTVPIVATLSHGVQVSGTLYPAYPGRNTLRLVLRWQGGVLAPAAPLTLVATMPGMAMAPIRARLAGHDLHYSGGVTLPMFGAYRAQIRILTPSGPSTGTVMLPLTLPRL